MTEETEDIWDVLDPGSEEAKEYAHSKNGNGWPRWMEPFSKIDLFGRPSVFSDKWDPAKKGHA